MCGICSLSFDRTQGSHLCPLQQQGAAGNCHLASRPTTAAQPEADAEAAVVLPGMHRWPPGPHTSLTAKRTGQDGALLLLLYGQKERVFAQGCVGTWLAEPPTVPTEPLTDES